MSDWKETYLGGSREDESKIFESFADDIVLFQQRQQKQGSFQHPRRLQHVKVHCATNCAELTIDPCLPEEYQTAGLAPGITYKECIVRLSNASGFVKPDNARDLRGFALRVPMAGNFSLDLLMTNAQTSHARTAKHFVGFVKAGTSGLIGKVLTFVFGLGPITSIKMIVTLLKQTSRRFKSLAGETFWSRAPFAVNGNAFQFYAKGVIDPEPVTKSEYKTLHPDYLSADFAQRLRNGAVEYEIYLRPFKDERNTPIEIGTAAWGDEVVADSDVRLGRITIPAHDISTDEAVRAAEEVDRVEFNPWNGARIFHPIGNLNRARNPAYRASANARALRTRARYPEGIFLRLLSLFGGLLNRIMRWDRWSPRLGALALGSIRKKLREDNLHDTRTALPRDPEKPEAPPCCHAARSGDGAYNDLTDPQMGLAGTSFGYNTPLEKVVPTAERRIEEPNPREVSRLLMQRDTFKPASTLNVLAAGWIQFMIHDWFAHSTGEENEEEAYKNRIRIPIDDDDPWREFAKDHEGNCVMEVRRTTIHKEIVAAGRTTPVYANRQSHWWNASQLYGTTMSIQKQIRTFRDGKIKFDDQKGLIPLNPETNLEFTGVTDNMWIGLAAMHHLFAREHNAICDALRAENPSWDDQNIFDVARLINSALLAKIHTVEWTPAILGHPTLKVAMEANWWGLLGRPLKNLLGRISHSETVSGIIGSDVDHHSAPYAFTEEFVTVYRMHPLLPDSFTIYDSKLFEKRKVFQLEDAAFEGARRIFESEPIDDIYFSLGVASPGAITLNNYPKFLQRLPRQGSDRIVDLAAVDIIRDRERGVPRYNDFRENLRLPRIASFEKLTSDLELARKIASVYKNDIDSVDTMVGLFAETPPKGFGFSDTAFRIFILMASRRLKSDRFFCEDYNETVYTRTGLDWIENNDMRSVIRRHHPALADSISRAGSAFEPWVKLNSSEDSGG